jgi:hypothetical protein
MSLGHFARMPLALTLEQWSWVATLISTALVLQKGDSRVQLQLAMTQYVNETAKIFVEHPEIRKYFHGCAQLPPVCVDPPGCTTADAANRERLLVEAAVVNFANALDFVLIHVGKLRRSGTDAWDEYFTTVWARSPALREFISTNQDWYSEETRQWIKARQQADAWRCA